MKSSVGLVEFSYANTLLLQFTIVSENRWRLVKTIILMSFDASILRLEDRGAGGCPALQGGMGFGRILQRVGMVDWHVQFAVDHGGKQRVRASEQFGAFADIVVEFRPGRKQRAVIVEFGNRKRRDRS